MEGQKSAVSAGPSSLENAAENGNSERHVDSRDIAILAELERNARVPVAVIAKKLKLPRRTVQFRIDRMARLGVIKKFIARVNNYILGDRTVELLLKLHEGSDHVAVAKGIASMPRVHCAFAMHGEWDIYAAVAFRNGDELKRILSGIYERYGNSIRQRGMMDAMSLHPFRSKLRLSQDGREDATIDDSLRASHSDDGRTTVTLTQKEEEAINVLRENSRIPAVELAERIGVTPDTAARMVKSLLDRRIVAAYTIQYDSSAVGYDRYMYFVLTGTTTTEQSRSLLNFSVKCKNVTYLIQGIGHYDYLIDLSVRGQKELMSVLAEIKTVLKGGTVREDIMLVEDAWYGEKILASAGSADAILPEPRERQRARSKSAYPAPTLMEFYKE